MKSLTKCSFLIFLFVVLGMPLRAVALPDVGDTVTELCLHRSSGERLIYSLQGSPLITFKGDSICIAQDTIMLSTLYSGDILSYTFRKRVAAVSVDSTVCESQLPVVWNGHIFDTTGVAQAILAANEGGDSTVRMTLHVVSTTYGQADISIVENQLPYTWNGRTYDYSVLSHGTGNLQTTILADTLTLPNVQGCDSLLVLNLTVYNNVFVQLDSTVCDDALPLTWNNHIFTLGGAQYDTLTNVYGADSMLTMALHVLPTYHLHFYDTICNNQTLTFGDSTYALQGDYTRILNTLTSPACDSLRTLHLTVYDTTTGDTTVVACDSFTWHGRTFTSSNSSNSLTSYNSIGGNAVGCDSTTYLHLTVNYSTTATYYDTCLENQLPRSFNGQAFVTDTSQVLFTLQNAVGCDSMLYYSLFIFHNINTQQDSTVCESELPIVWNGATFESEGQQRVVYTAHTGADSIVILTLHVIPTTYGEYYDTIGPDELPHIFLHHTYTEAVEGDTLMLTSSLGCDSVLTYSLYVRSIDSVGIGTVIPDAGTLVFNGHTLTVHSNSIGCEAWLYTVDGRLLWHRRIGANKVEQYTMDSLPAGIYMVKINDKTYKIVQI